MNTTCKKLVLVIALCLCMMLTMLPALPFTAMAASSLSTTIINGTTYYQISNADDLYLFAQMVNGGEKTANAILTADIVVNKSVLKADGTLNGTPSRTWTPIGISSYAYAGTFEGGGHTISGLYCKTSGTYYGLFGYVAKNGKVQNVGIVDSFISARDYVGGIAGCNQGTVTNCFNAGTISGTYYYIGGVVGDNSGTVTSSYNIGTVSCTNYNAGGLVGYNSGTVSNSYNTGSVSGTYRIGGVVGNQSSGTLKGCYNVGTVTGTSYSVGGVAGSGSGTISGCYYLTGCATDGASVSQRGIGSTTKGSTTSDSASKTVAKTADQFASGETCYLLNGSKSSGTLTWFQTCGEGTPAFSGSVVYYGYADCKATARTYSNSPMGSTQGSHVYGSDRLCVGCGLECPHTTYTANGFCAVCQGYQPANGSGAEGDPYTISNAGQLYWFAAVVDSGYGSVAKNPAAHAKLTASIDLNPGYEFAFHDDSGTVQILKSGTLLAYLGTGIPGDTSGSNATFDTTASKKGAIYANLNDSTADSVSIADIRVWTPIGYYSSSSNHAKYTGTFDGNFCTISGMFMNDITTDYVGLFAYVGEGGTVQNVGIENCFLYGNGSCDYLGSVVGYNYGIVKSSYNTGVICSSRYYAGGIVGCNYGTVTDCHMVGIISGYDYVGGVVGRNANTVERCDNTGIVRSSGRNIGGVVGHNYYATVKDSHNAGIVSYVPSTSNSVSGWETGGVVGENEYGTVTTSYNTGHVSGGRFVGGVTGSNDHGTVTSCYNTGDVTSSSDYCAGVVGNNFYATLTNCYNTGTVTGGGYYSGGVTGIYDYDGTISKCYYLTGSAKDGNGKIHNGTGSSSSSYANSDVSGATIVLTADQFASGEACYLLNGSTSEGELTWFQTCGVGTPAFSGKTVYYCYAGCKATERTYENEPMSATLGGHIYDSDGVCVDCGRVQCLHTAYDSDGFCVACGDYQPAEGSGTAEDPYTIGNAGQLYWFAAVINGGYGDTVQNAAAYGILIDDIVINEKVLNEDGTLNGTPARVWKPIGFYTSSADNLAFSGTIDGDGHTISGLYFNDPAASYVGFISYLGDLGNVQNVGIVDSYICGANNVGGIVGYITNNLTYKSTVTNCYHTGTVIGSNYVGGVVGYNKYGIVKNCYNTGSVNGGKNAGGLAGYNDGNVIDSYSTGPVSGTSYIGGLAGYNDGTLKNCHSTGSVSGASYIGGLAGMNYSYIVYCYNTGSITGTGSYVGGLIGYNSERYAHLQNCYNMGSVSGNRYVGGVVGYNYINAEVLNCYNHGMVSGNDNYVGGVVGYLYSTTMKNCYYLTGCATDGNGTVQNGCGAETKGSAVADVEGKSAAMTADQFASGEVAWLLNGATSEGDLVWFQTCGEGYPHFEGQTVYRNQIGGCGNKPLYGYANVAADATLSHTEVIDEAVDATCTETGLTEGKHCDVCGEVLVAQEVVAALGHTEETIPGKAATCTETGLTEGKKCSVCGETIVAQEEIPTLGHDMVAGEVTAPTCTAGGYTTYNCSRCDHTEQKDQVAALGHSYDAGVVTTEPGCETTGVKIFTCSCGDSYTEEIAATGHTYVDGVCDNCGEAEPVEKFKLAGANMALGNTLTMNFFIYKTDVSDTDFYAVITHYNADGTIANELTLPYAQWDVRSTYYAISLPLFARQMADKIEVVVYNGKDVAVSETWTDSVRDYVMRNIDKSSFAAARTVMVDMLNYGAAAQINRKYNTTDLANNQLTAAHQAYATANVTAQNKLVAGTNYYGSSLTMKENLILTIYFKNITSDMYAVVEYTDYHGDHYKYEVAGTDFASVGSYKGVVINDLLVADGDVLVNVIIYDASGNEVASASDSMNSYAVRQIEKASDDAIYEMIAKFTASAKAYLGG